MAPRTDATVAFTAGLTEVRVARDEAAMGAATAAFLAAAMKTAAARGKRPALWLMAAPSAFSFYAAFTALASTDPALAALCRQAIWYQFDDYPIRRGDPRFPITFRSLLEKRLFEPLRNVCGKVDDVRLLEIGGADEEQVCADYAARLLETAQDPRCYLIELKGTGMDGHWGFHGAETPLDAAPAVIKVPMSAANIHQQKLDWPAYFEHDSDVPAYACTGTVSLFMKARIIVDNVPQASKAYSVLAAYGNDRITASIPSSALKRHPHSHAFLTADAAWALLAFREATARDPRAKLSPSILRRLEELWNSADRDTTAANIAQMRSVLRELDML